MKKAPHKYLEKKAKLICINFADHEPAGFSSPFPMASA